MPLATTLTNNEIKNASNVEREFNKVDGAGRKIVYSRTGAQLNLPHLITVQHEEVGSGTAKKRNSNFSVLYTELGADGVTPVTWFGSLTLRSPVGAVTSDAGGKEVLANIASGLATPGATSVLDLATNGTFGQALREGYIN